MLSQTTMKNAHAAMKKIAPDFKFMPTVYPGFLGVYAGGSGYTLGVGAGLPFDNTTSAAVSLAPAGAGVGAPTRLVPILDQQWLFEFLAQLHLVNVRPQRFGL